MNVVVVKSIPHYTRGKSNLREQGKNIFVESGGKIFDKTII